ncbi:hypothetical protein HJC23_000058 [Cyclotella cryptica]|uniref:ADP,ATP carrier protein n=1 Tax=Cyclotella cryptica TaxID=29204 RepID=A0ABD3PHE0_9STRA
MNIRRAAAAESSNADSGSRNHSDGQGCPLSSVRKNGADVSSHESIKKNSEDVSSSPSLCSAKHRDGVVLRSKRFQAVFGMAMSLAIHLGGYELSRAAVMALFTSDGLGFGKSHHTTSSSEGGLSALPMAVGCVSPFSIMLLWFYAKTLVLGGPRYALQIHTMICAGAQIFCGWLLGALDQLLELKKEDGAALIVPGLSFGVKDVLTLSQPTLFLLFVFQNAYVQLLYNQHWAFISSVLTPDEGTQAFAPIAGLGSIGSTLAAGMVSTLVERFGLIRLLYMAGALFVMSAVFADVAFGLARKHGFEPSGDNEQRSAEKSFSNEQEQRLLATKKHSIHGKMASTVSTQNIFRQAYSLFQRVPVLGALFLEVIISQCLSSLVNYIFLYKLKVSITDDSMRAGWSGNFYAWINGISGVLQFFIIPILLKYCEAHRIWLFMPTMMLFCTMYQFVNNTNSGLFAASASFFAIKTMEYSLRGAANEMLYVSLDYESRYLGKKVISLIAGKFGKSAMAIALSAVMVVYGERADTMWYLLATAVVFSCLWLLSSVRLHSLIKNHLKH